MSSVLHDPSEYVRGLQQLLVSDKKRIGFLFGAGTSLAKKNSKSLTIPAIGRMTSILEEKISENPLFKTAIEEIKNELGVERFNVETFLSNLEGKKSIIGNGELNGLKKHDFDRLILEVKKNVIEIVSIHKTIIANDGYNDLIHLDFAEWIGRANRKYPIELFTTNYDYLFELGLERKSIPYYDGFTGSYEPFFNSQVIERLDFLPNQTKLWKIHGSLGWKLEQGTKKVIRKESIEDDILIYPSSLKYDNSRKQPYIALMDRLSNFIKQSDTVLIVCGYSFGDEHINERILTSIKQSNTAHVFAFMYDKYWDDGEYKYSLTENSSLSKLAKENSKISIFGCRSAIIGSQFGNWKLKKQLDTDGKSLQSFYFAEDVVEEGEVWNGSGELKLVDFKSFTLFLKTMIGDEGGTNNE